MPRESISIHPDLRVAVLCYTGVVDDAQCRAGFRAIHSEPSFEPGMDVLLDHTGTTRLDVTPAGIRGLIADMERKADEDRHFRIAVVAPTDVTYGMARMYQMLWKDEPERVGVFRSPAEAWRFLGHDAVPEVAG